MPVRKIIIGVIGAANPSEVGLRVAEAVGRELAGRGAILVCGGLGGVMEAAAKGAVEAGGEVLGILPGPDKRSANPFVTLPVPTNMGHARNVIIAHTADALIAVEGEYGTLSETAIGLKLGKPVFVLPGGQQIAGTVAVASATEAVTLAFESLKP
ncbi:MAG: TIGR00725 family protein [Desulfuromonadales bacterium]